MSIKRIREPDIYLTEGEEQRLRYEYERTMRFRAEAAVSRVMKIVRHEALLAGESTGKLFLKALAKKIEGERR